LNDIINNQRSPNDRTRFGYTQDSTCITQRTNKRPIIYENSLKRSLRREDNKENMRPLKTDLNKQKSTLPTKEKDDKKNTIT
jgi:hypothetical protein